MIRIPAGNKLGTFFWQTSSAPNELAPPSVPRPPNHSLHISAASVLHGQKMAINCLEFKRSWFQLFDYSGLTLCLACHRSFHAAHKSERRPSAL